MKLLSGTEDHAWTIGLNESTLKKALKAAEYADAHLGQADWQDHLSFVFAVQDNAYLHPDLVYRFELECQRLHTERSERNFQRIKREENRAHALERARLIEKLGLAPEESNAPYAASTGEFWQCVAEKYGVDIAEACGGQQ